MNKKRRVLSGSDRMYANGKKPSQLWYTPEQYEMVRKAAKVVGRPMTQFAVRAAVASAKFFLDANGLNVSNATTTKTSPGEKKGKK